jgi:L-seryl-tRNA(Ser) seleniumtransferase
VNKSTASARDAQPPKKSSSLPSVDRIANHAGLADAIEQHGRDAVVKAIQHVLGHLRSDLIAMGTEAAIPSPEQMTVDVQRRLKDQSVRFLRAVFNLSGTVLHTNLGRAPLPDEAIEAIRSVAGGACNVEYDLVTGNRGDRDDVVSELLSELTGCEAATVVNNNAAAVLLTLNSLANRREAIVSRGEQIEIGGSFRMPSIMTGAGCRLREVGTTNRTHLHDYADAIGPKTGVILKVHTSNYSVEGFASSVDEAELGALAKRSGIPLVVDLGSGSLTDLTRWGLPREPLPQDALAHGAGVVTFSGDKLLGGPQAGIIVGNAELVARIKKNPLKRALRVDKITLAALEAVLRLYRDPARLASRLPSLRLITRPHSDIGALAGRLKPLIENALPTQDGASVTVEPCFSQIGSGAMPVELLSSFCIAIRGGVSGRGSGSFLKRMENGFRQLPMPVIGRISDGAYRLDLRCLEDEARFVSQLPLLASALS